ncbi:MAG: amino acid ABC transporter permease [Solobacterium sp.]|nr:amino acid ABC transporter permease [Solobacterium sp.]
MEPRWLRILLGSFFKILIPGIIYTIPLTLVSFALGLIIAIVVALIRVSKVKVLDKICWFYVWVFRGTPLLVQLFVIFYGLPNIGIKLSALPSAIIAFSLNIGAYASETIRGSILAVPKTQKEACSACGFTYVQQMAYVVLPQALKISIPALFNSFISLVKDTSLASNITVTEMFMATQRIVATTFEPLLLYLEVGFIYLMFCTILTYVQKVIEGKLSVSDTGTKEASA